MSSFNFRDCFGVMVTVTVEMEEVVDIMVLVVLAEICRPSNYKANLLVVVVVVVFTLRAEKENFISKSFLKQIVTTKNMKQVIPFS